MLSFFISLFITLRPMLESVSFVPHHLIDFTFITTVELRADENVSPEIRNIPWFC